MGCRMLSTSTPEKRDLQNRSTLPTGHIRSLVHLQGLLCAYSHKEEDGHHSLSLGNTKSVGKTEG